MEAVKGETYECCFMVDVIKSGCIRKVAKLNKKAAVLFPKKDGSFYSVVIINAFPCFNKSCGINQPSIF